MKEFKDLSINIRDPKYGDWWERSAHSSTLSTYNEEWGKFLINATSIGAVEAEVRKCALEYGFTIGF